MIEDNMTVFIRDAARRGSVTQPGRGASRGWMEGASRLLGVAAGDGASRRDKSIWRGPDTSHTASLKHHRDRAGGEYRVDGTRVHSGKPVDSVARIVGGLKPVGTH